MSRQSFPLFLRRSIWQTHNRKCAYCSSFIEFKDLEIDHIIPESLNLLEKKDKEIELINLGLDKTFDINSLENLLPSCHTCNSKKSDTLFTVGQVAIFVAIAKRNIVNIRDLTFQFEQKEKREKINFSIAKHISNGVSPTSILNELKIISQKQKIDQLSLFSNVNLYDMSKKEYEMILDKNPDLSRFHCSGLNLVHDNGSKLTVYSLRDYLNAKKIIFMLLLHSI